MKNFKTIATICTFLAISTVANAGIINFVDLAASEGEGGALVFDAPWITNNPAQKALFIEAGLSISAGQDNPYLDSKIGSKVAGLGVCSNLNGSKQCSPSSDDNVSSGESAIFSFANAVTITNIWLNNNHDGNFAAGTGFGLGTDGGFFNVPILDGILTGATLSESDMTDPAFGIMNALGVSVFDVAAGSSFSLGFIHHGPQFYISALEYELQDGPTTTSVPVAATLPLFGLGLIGMIGFRRKRA